MSEDEVGTRIDHGSGEASQVSTILTQKSLTTMRHMESLAALCAPMKADDDDIIFRYQRPL